jgi:uncharacterized membrane protein
MEKNKTVLGIDQNIEGMLCYVLGFVTGIIFMVLEKENQFVRFHAIQSTVVFLALFALNLVVGFIPVIGLLSVAISLLGVILWIFLMVKAFKGEKYKLPWAGEIAEKQVSKTKG